jgi:hypothetical protein
VNLGTLESAFANYQKERLIKSESSRQQHRTEEEKKGKFNETAHPLNIYREPATIEWLRRLKKQEERRKEVVCASRRALLMTSRISKDENSLEEIRLFRKLGFLEKICSLGLACESNQLVLSYLCLEILDLGSQPGCFLLGCFSSS